MQQGRGVGLRLAAATAAALAVILAGALFLIAPVWQPGYRPVQYQAWQPQPAATPAPLLDLNTADASELTALPGIGQVKAAAIVAYREEHGPFASMEELAQVKGISLSMVEQWTGLAYAGQEATE